MISTMCSFGSDQSRIRSFLPQLVPYNFSVENRRVVLDNIEWYLRTNMVYIALSTMHTTMGFLHHSCATPALNVKGNACQRMFPFWECGSIGADLLSFHHRRTREALRVMRKAAWALANILFKCIGKSSIFVPDTF